MKKRKAILITSLLCSSLLLSCGGNEENNPPIGENQGEDENKPDKDENPEGGEKPEPEKEKFDIKTTCDAGSFDNESYAITTIKPNDEYYDFNDPILRININKNNWSYVTQIKEDKVKILSENEEILPSTALKYRLDTGDGSSANDIKGIELQIDRTKVKIGTTKVKVHFEPSNGVNTASVLELCVPVEVKEFGSTTPEIVKTKVELDLSGASEFDFTKDVEFNVQDDDYEYGYSYKTVTTYLVKEEQSTLEEVNIPLGQSLYFFARTYNEQNKPVSYKLKIESDSSFDEVGENYKFSETPTETLKISIDKKL